MKKKAAPAKPEVSADELLAQMLDQRFNEGREQGRAEAGSQNANSTALVLRLLADLQESAASRMSGVDEEVKVALYAGAENLRELADGL